MKTQPLKKSTLRPHVFHFSFSPLSGDRVEDPGFQKSVERKKQSESQNTNKMCITGLKSQRETPSLSLFFQMRYKVLVFKFF